MKKVVFFVNDLNAGGIENYLLRFLNHYDGELIATVVCKSAQLGELEGLYREIKHISLVQLKVGYLDPVGYRALYFMLRKEKYDAVVDFTGNFAAFPLLMARLAKIKKRIVFYRGATNHFKDNIYRNAYNNFLNGIVRKSSTAILSNSRAALNFFFKDQKSEKFEVVYNGIDAARFLNSNKNLRQEFNIPTDAFVVSHVGRFTEAKNHKTIIEVAVQLCKQNEGLYFILCGKNVDVNLSNRVKDENLSDKIILLGYRNDVISVLNSSDVFYFPSLTEGQPNALLEALIAGLPFVASNIDPIKETIPEKFHHFLVDPEDTIAAVNKLQYLYDDERTRKELDLRLWAKENYEPNYLFNKFYIKL